MNWLFLSVNCARFCILLFAVSLLLSCADAAPAGRSGDAFKTKDGVSINTEIVAEGLEVPWGFAWLPNGDMLVTERPGRVRIIEKDKLRPEPLFTVPDVEPSSESGLMDISTHPNFAQNKFVYLAYAYNNDGKFVKIVRYTFKDNKLTQDKIIIDKIPAAPNHAGTRARFGPDGKLYIITGDSTDWNLAQVNDSLAGKTLRLNDDGSVPQDNPFIKKEGYRPEIYSTGHRNPQGLAWQPGSGIMFQTEHGPSQFEGRGGGGDEVNIVKAGQNYGWPIISHKEEKAGLVSPLLEYSPACAPASAAFYDGSKISQFKGNFFFGCLRGARIIRVILDGEKVVSQEDIYDKTFGRIREIGQGPDGYLYFSTSNRDGRGSPLKNDDRILRIIPAETK